MEKLTRQKFVILVGLVAFAAAAAGTALTFQYLENNFGDSVPGLDLGFLRGFKSGTGTTTEGEINERVLRQDELVVQTVARVAPAVVAIVAAKDVPVFEQYFVSPFGDDPFFKQFFGDRFQIPQERQKGTEKRQVSSGTGFIISPEGLIVTNKHVVADAEAEYTVFFNDGKKLSAKVLARDPLQDLAVLKVDRAGLPSLMLGDSASAKIGQTVIAIGNALGEFSNSVSVGVVSGLQRSITAFGRGIGSEDLTELIQTDAAINPGNSGGPLLNLRGEVIGMNTAIVEGAENIGFAIPVNKLKRSIASVQKTGRIIYPFLGVRYLTINENAAKTYNLSVSDGAWLKGDNQGPAVVPGSPADKAGLREGDIVVEINGQKLDQSHTLSSVLGGFGVGDSITLAYLHNGARQTTSVTLVERTQ
ncbi:MAG: trypsin-like peptidase domain-containing protein [Candidatus Sungbacteria bacterium]|uniref:Trypsin-like peptidase domain-containing protein n=1 Tax=Candidatus Sungiibacteriota bacterium TaxID=2750080 RepID=A0A931SCR2_9BACT|nr:trypsin-like peptidase domain-containing protein [Candidatus Sungbacteria bacterium]